MKRMTGKTGVAGRVSLEFLEQRTLFAVPGLPRPDHIVIVVEENKAAASIVGSASAPYITSLANGGAYFTQSYAIEHPSQPNYLDLFSGANQGVTNDGLPSGLPFTSPNLAANLRAKGVSFAGYSESLPDSGLTTDSGISGGYRRKHNPWVNWQNDATPSANQLPSSMNRNLSAFTSDFTQLPTVSFVIPTQYNDMHDDKSGDGLNAIQAGDNWLKAHLDAYAQWARTHNSLLIVTFDEDDNYANNQIATIFYGQVVQAGSYSAKITHFSVLRTLEDLYGTAYAGASASASPITDVWAKGTIGGYLWSDTNANGVKDAAEGFTSAREVYIDANKNGVKDAGERSVMSDASGNYQFSNLLPGTYRIRRTSLPAGYRYSSPLLGSNDVTVTSGQVVTGKNIGATTRAYVAGTVFKDANANKLKDAGEAGLSGWKVFIDANGNGVLDSTEKYAATDASGNFVFTDLVAGTYKVRLQAKSGYTVTTPSGGLATITLSNGQSKTGLLFGVR